MTTRYMLQHALIQAPMAGVTTPTFVATCCEAGFLGNIGAGYLNGEQTREFIREVKSLTKKPFGVNLFVQEEPKIDIVNLQNARIALQPYYEELNINPVQTVVSDDVFTGQVQAVIDEGVDVCSFTFGLPPAHVIDRLKAAGVYCIGTATTVEEAIAVQNAGLHAVVAQGKEAGGHRGSFINEPVYTGTAALVEAIVKQVTIPVIAAGGIMNKAQKEQMLAIGAAAVQVGTALIVADECEVSELHKQAIMTSAPGTTTLTKAFTGKYARGIQNTFTEQMAEEVVAPYPLQHYLTLPIRKESTVQNKPQYLALWMGEHSYMAQQRTVAQIYQAFL